MSSEIIVVVIMHLSLALATGTLVEPALARTFFESDANFVSVWSRLTTIEYIISYCSIFWSILCKYDVILSSRIFLLLLPVQLVAVFFM